MLNFTSDGMSLMDNKQNMIREMLARADARLQAQQQLAIAADARAMQFCATCVAGASLTVAIGGQDITLPYYTIALFLVIAAGLAFWAARPIEWHAPGMRPSAFESDLASDAEFYSVLEELCSHLEGSITENGAILSENANHFRLAAVFAIMAPILGGVALMITGPS